MAMDIKILRWADDTNWAVINKNGNEFILTEDEYRQLRDTFQKEVYYREDVLDYLEDYDKPDGITEEEFVEAVLEEYAGNRREYDGYGMNNWMDCLDMALDAVYKKYGLERGDE